jgi:hypothetical protein
MHSALYGNNRSLVSKHGSDFVGEIVQGVPVFSKNNYLFTGMGLCGLSVIALGVHQGIVLQRF